MSYEDWIDGIHPEDQPGPRRDPFAHIEEKHFPLGVDFEDPLDTDPLEDK